MEVDQVDKVDNGSGNTISSPNDANDVESDMKKKSQCRKWCFTDNNYEVDKVDKILDLLRDASEKGIFGEEIGKNGTRHLQGFLVFKNGRTLGGVKKLLEKAHWERTKGSDASNFKYCSKEGKYKMWGDWPEVVEDVLDGVELHDWQKDIITKCKEKPDRRKIYWYWEPEGNVGKTVLAKHMVLKHDALYVSGKSADVKCAIAAMKVKPKIVVFACPRSGQDYMSYAALEEVKDGLFFSGKYESGMCAFNIPHVFVFANFEPEYGKLSSDRWEVVCLNSF